MVSQCPTHLLRASLPPPSRPLDIGEQKVTTPDGAPTQASAPVIEAGSGLIPAASYEHPRALHPLAMSS